jgi:hypothetical protein
MQAKPSSHEGSLNWGDSPEMEVGLQIADFSPFDHPFVPFPRDVFESLLQYDAVEAQTSSHLRRPIVTSSTSPHITEVQSVIAQCVEGQCRFAVADDSPDLKTMTMSGLGCSPLFASCRPSCPQCVPCKGLEVRKAHTREIE